MRKKLLIVGLTFVIIVLFGFLTIPSRRTDGTFPSTVFLGYTNDPAAGRMALFRFSNSTPVLVERWYFYEIQFQTETGWISQGTSSFPSSQTQPLLRSHQSEVVAVTVPKTQGQWRLGFPYMQHGTLVRRFGGDVLLRLQKIGFPSRHDRSKDWSYSDDITP